MGLFGNKTTVKEAAKAGETLADLGMLPFVNLMHEIWVAQVSAMEATQSKAPTPDRLKELKTLVSVQNSFLNGYKTRMTYWKMTGVNDKIKAIENAQKSRRSSRKK